LNKISQIRVHGVDYEIADANAQEFIGSLDNSVVRYVEVTGTNPTINGEANTIYLCGEVSTISVTPPATGMIGVRFRSGSSVALLNIPSSVRWPASFDPYALQTNTVYELNILDGIYGAVIAWTS